MRSCRTILTQEVLLHRLSLMYIAGQFVVGSLQQILQILQREYRISTDIFRGLKSELELVLSQRGGP